VIFGLASTAARLLAAAGFLIDGGPSAPLGLVLRDASVLVAFLYVLRLPFLLIRVCRFVAAWH
jgi:hypothetical protein